MSPVFLFLIFTASAFWPLADAHAAFCSADPRGEAVCRSLKDLVSEEKEIDHLVKTIAASRPKSMRDLLKGSVLHETSQFMADVSPKDQDSTQSFVSSMNEYLQVLSHGKAEMSQKKKEQLSAFHQLDLIRGVPREKLGYLRSLGRGGLNWNAYQIGAINSDMGKLDIYKKLLTEKSDKSDLLLGVLSGTLACEATDALREVLTEAGWGPKRKGDPLLLNSQGDIQNLRDLFTAVPSLQGFLHELPGTADTILAFQIGLISKEDFKAAFKTNLFHNGPQVGYWKSLSHETVAVDIQNKCSNGRTLLAGTPFEPKDGVFAPHYPLTTSFEGAIHTFLDRMSQASRGGLLKIYEELGFWNPPRRIHDLSTNNNRNTQRQLQKLKEESLGNPRFDQAQQVYLAHSADRGIARLKMLQEHIEKRIEFSDYVKEKTDTGEASFPTKVAFTFETGKIVKVDFHPRDGSCAVDGSLLKDCNEIFFRSYSQVLKDEERKNGDPMKILY